MNEVIAAHPDPDLQIHVVLDNLNTHKPRHDRWLVRHRRTSQRSCLGLWVLRLSRTTWICRSGSGWAARTSFMKSRNSRRRRREFLDFMNEVLAAHPDPDLQIHVVLDNLNTHKPKHDRWLARHRNVHFHFTPTHASWLNQVEVWFSILSRRALAGASARRLRME